MNSWAVLAGLLRVEEAGGRTGDFFGSDGLFRGNRVLAAAPWIFPIIEGLAG